MYRKFIHTITFIDAETCYKFIVPRLSRKRVTLKLIRPSVCPSVCQSLCHKNFNLAHIFWSINDRALIFGMHDPCDKPFLLIPCGDLDLDLWPTSRSNLFTGGGPQFFEFACYDNDSIASTSILSVLCYIKICLLFVYIYTCTIDFTDIKLW